MAVNKDLPIDALLPEILSELKTSNRLIVEAAPGAGKSTRVPLALLESEEFSHKKIYLLEPRRVAARNLADFLASQLGESLGETVGLHVRFDRQVSDRTRLIVMTDGMFVRYLQRDPELSGVGAVIFDEFHERRLDSDLGLALAKEAQEGLREDLRLLVMSATLEGLDLGSYLDCNHLKSNGRSYPVETAYQPIDRENFGAIARAIRSFVQGQEGATLVFLPGAYHIDRLADILSDIQVDRLYGALPLAEQRRVLQSQAGKRIILSTNLAESSLTVPDVRAVVDLGLEKVPVFDAATGLTRLETRRISQASAKQRAGRAGRLAPGQCLRLWDKHDRLVPAADAEISAADLSTLVLQTRQWGTDARELDWLTPPSDGAVNQGEDLLQLLGLLDEHMRPTELASLANAFPVHPRLGTMLAQATQSFSLACQIAAVLESGQRIDPTGIETAVRNMSRNARRIEQQLSKRRNKSSPTHASKRSVAELLALAFPDRIAKQRDAGSDQFLLASGRGAKVTSASLRKHSLIVTAELRFRTPDVFIDWAEPIDMETIQRLFSERLEQRTITGWDDKGDRIVAEDQLTLGALVLERSSGSASPEDIAEAICQRVRKSGVDSLNWNGGAAALRNRLACLHHADSDNWPDVSDAALLDRANEWLRPFLPGASRWSDLREDILRQGLMALLSGSQFTALDSLVPERLDIPSGRSAPVDYSDPERPVLAAKLQEFFGAKSSPTVANGRVPITIHLLDPAGRPLAITQDLAFFWREAYPQVRKEMRGRYVKHPWPEDPVAANATAKTNRALRNN